MRWLIVGLVTFGGIACAIVGLTASGHHIDTRTLVVERPTDQAILALVRRRADSDAIELRISDALRDGDIDLAQKYVNLALRADIPFDRNLRLDVRESITVDRTAETGEAENRRVASGATTSAAALASASIADLTIEGDEREIARQGLLLNAGEDYNEFLLGLAIAGVAADKNAGAAGEDRSVRIGLSVLKVGGKAGLLTEDFARTVSGVVAEAVDFPQVEISLQDADLTTPRRARLALDEKAVTLRGTALIDLARELSQIARNAGAGEAILLLGEIQRMDDLRRISEIAEVTGPDTRQIIDLTRITSVESVDRFVGPWAFAGENIRLILLWLMAIAAPLLLPGFRRLRRP